MATTYHLILQHRNGDIKRVQGNRPFTTSDLDWYEDPFNHSDPNYHLNGSFKVINIFQTED